MKQFKYYLMAAFVAAVTCTGFSSCSDNDDEESTVNPAVDVVSKTKQHDTAILLCTFGSTYNESLTVYDEIIEDFKAKFPNTDIYMSFTSRTCTGRCLAGENCNHLYFKALRLRAGLCVVYGIKKKHPAGEMKQIQEI